jgi:cell division protease FtsH
VTAHEKGGGTEERGFAALGKRAAAQEPESVDDAMDVADEETARPTGSFDRAKILALIVDAALRRATTKADRHRALRDGRPAAVVIGVSSATWIDPVERYIERLRPDWLVMARDGSDRHRHKASVGNDCVGRALAKGRSVVGVATDPERQLPRTLMAAADVRIDVAGLDPAIVGKVMRSCFPGDDVPTIPSDALAALELDDVVAAMRPGITAADTIELMSRASRRRAAGDDVSTAPVLATAVEFGAAREFGLALAQDIIDFKQGGAWSDAMKGGIFFGPSGTGKSTLAASIAAAAGVPFLRFSVASMFDKDSHLGTVCAALRETMSLAQAAAAAAKCCIAMYEEVEFIPRRDQLDAHGRSFWTPIIDLLLLLTDAGLAPDEKNGGAGRPVGVFLLGATNHLDMVEPALLRPNRFERAVEVTRPDAAGVANILRFHLGSALAGDDLSGIARSLEGATAAECMAVVRAARRAARRADRPLRLTDLATAAHGDDVRSPQVAWRIAVHEAAHAVTTVVTGEGGLVYVSIQGHGGRTRIEGDRDDLPTLESVERTVVCLLAAGAAESSIVGSLSIGWSGSDGSDLGKVSSMLAHLHASSGLTGNLFMRAGEPDAALAAVRGDPELGRAVEEHLRCLHGRAVALVGRHRDRIVAVAEALVERRHLDAAEVVTIVSGIPENTNE